MTPIEAIAELQKDPTIAKWIGGVEAVYSSSLRRYSATNPRPRAAKAVKDNIWGMVDVTAAEVVVLDSPPLQRLRRIRQLGVSYLTYPTAGYSRFEHSIGAMHQSERMLRAIERRSSNNLSSTLVDALPVVRLAALLHDVGHLPLSHLSERYFDARESRDSEAIAEAFGLKQVVRRILRAQKPSLSECLSLLTILAPSFYHLLTSNAGYAEEDVATAALAIVGRPASNQRAFLMQLITNAIDADKLDYMFRDSAATGVPVGIDLERLLYKLSCIEVSGDEIPRELADMFGVTDPAIVLATDLGGYQLAYDLAAARSILFERIYFHHKTRSAERVVLHLLAQIAPKPLELLAADDGFFAPSGVNGQKQEVLRLAERRLPRRVFAFSKQYLLDQASLSPAGRMDLPSKVSEGWEDLRDILMDARSRDTLVDEIVTAANELAELTEQSPSESGDYWLEPALDPYDVGEAQLLVRRPDGTSGVEPSFPAKAAAHTLNPSETVYVYTDVDNDAAALIHVSIEVALSRQFGLHFGRDAADHAKFDRRLSERLKRKIDSKEPIFFNFDGRLRAPSDEVRRHRGRCISIADRLSSYMPGVPGFKLNVEQVYEFVDQFPEPLVPAAIEMLEKFRFLGRDDLGTNFGDWIAETTPGQVMAALTTDPGKSANLLSYFLGDSPLSLKQKTMEEALAGPENLCLFDDFIISGVQARVALQLLLGMEPDKANEDVAYPLRDEMRRRLLEKKVCFRFACGTEQGVTHLASLVRSIWDAEPDIRIMHNASTPTVEGIDVGLAEFLRTVGSALLNSTKGSENPVKWTPELCAERALGYGGDGLIVSTFYNTPTGTATPIWASGEYRAVPWKALLPRRTPIRPGVPSKPGDEVGPPAG